MRTRLPISQVSPMTTRSVVDEETLVNGCARMDVDTGDTVRVLVIILGMRESRARITHGRAGSW